VRVGEGLPGAWGAVEILLARAWLSLCLLLSPPPNPESVSLPLLYPLAGRGGGGSGCKGRPDRKSKRDRAGDDKWDTKTAAELWALAAASAASAAASDSHDSDQSDRAYGALLARAKWLMDHVVSLGKAARREGQVSARVRAGEWELREVPGV
jgi:hypothetical protein